MALIHEIWIYFIIYRVHGPSHHFRLFWWLNKYYKAYYKPYMAPLIYSSIFLHIPENMSVLNRFIYIKRLKLWHRQWIWLRKISFHYIIMHSTIYIAQTIEWKDIEVHKLFWSIRKHSKGFKLNLWISLILRSLRV